jgi:WD40 repeat protein
MDLFKSYISKNGFTARYKSVFSDEIKFEGSFNKGKTVHAMLEELRDVADYKHHVIMQKLVVKRFQPAPVIQDLTKVVQIVKFDNVHKDAVNCVDIDPLGKLLVSASSDGTIRFIDLESMKEINELVVRTINKKKIKAICIDDKHNVAYVDETNKISIYSIGQGKVIAEYQGGSLSELTDIIPN